MLERLDARLVEILCLAATCTRMTRLVGNTDAVFWGRLTSHNGAAMQWYSFSLCILQHQSLVSLGQSILMNGKTIILLQLFNLAFCEIPFSSNSLAICTFGGLEGHSFLDVTYTVQLFNLATIIDTFYWGESLESNGQDSSKCNWWSVGKECHWRLQPTKRATQRSIFNKSC